MSQPTQPYEPPIQPYGPPPQQPEMGQLVLNLRKPSFVMSPTKVTPTITIDGRPAPARWEQNVFPVVAGPHLVQVGSLYLQDFGVAKMPVTIQPGQSLELHYAGPLLNFYGGRIGLGKQPRAGTITFWSIIVFPILVLMLLFVVAFNS